MQRALVAVGEVLSEYTSGASTKLHFALVLWRAGEPGEPVYGAGADKTLGLERMHAETRQAIVAMAESFDEHNFKGVDDGR